MTAHYDLRPGEWVVLEAGQGAHLRNAANPSRPSFKGSIQELILTNHNIVATTLSMFQKPKQQRIFPLGDIVLIHGEPHLRVAGTIGQYLLEVHFMHGKETFSFQGKQEVQRWVRSVRDLVTGADVAFDPMWSSAPPGPTEYLKDVVGTVRDFLGMGSSAALPPPPPPMAPCVTSRCASCGASISGQEGRVVGCEACGSTQEL